MERVIELFFDLGLMRAALPALVTEGLRVTLTISVGAILIGLVAGMLLALLTISRRWWVRLPGVVYIDIFRGLPAILTIFLIGVGLPIAGVRPFGRVQVAYGILALGLIATAYIAEIFRAGIQSVDKGQMEAARSLGMPYLTAMRLVIIPQGLRRVLPPLTNEFIAITKDSSLVYILGFAPGARDLFRIGQNLQQQTGNSSAVVMAGIAYLAITVPLTRLVNHMDRRLREGKPGGGEPEAATLSVRTEH
jgi:His/Glu/Gln/Arg/opine family amino acid ABC transporter permease subunit